MEKIITTITDSLKTLIDEFPKYDGNPALQRSLINANTLMCCAVDYLRMFESLKPKFDVHPKESVTLPKKSKQIAL